MDITLTNLLGVLISFDELFSIQPYVFIDTIIDTFRFFMR
jgi:hypothetical protein